MLDPRIYRAALLPVLLALLVVAFSLEGRPAPLRSTPAVETFDGARAMRQLAVLSTSFPERRPGGSQDTALAGVVARELRQALPGVVVRSDRFTGRTIDGERDLVTVSAAVPGSSPGAQLVVVAARDATGHGAAARLSGTAALLELARTIGTMRPARGVTFASISGGTGGQAGMRDLVRRLEGPVDAVVELGDLAGPDSGLPPVVGWSDSRGTAPLRLARTAQLALRVETGREPATASSAAQLARLAWPFAVGPQGVANAAGLPTVRLSASGEPPPPRDAPLSAARLEARGRAALRTLLALQAGPRIAPATESRLTVARRTLPEWAVRVLSLALLLPALLTVIDGVARLRRRGEPLLRWLGWVASLGAPFLLAGLFARGIGAFGALPATAPPALPVDAPLRGADWAALGVVLVVLALGFLLVRPLLARWARATEPGGAPGATLAPALVAVLGGLVAWLVNPYAALLLALPASLWLVLADGGPRPPRPVALALVTASLAPPAMLIASLADQLAVPIADVPWLALLGLAGGQGGPWELVGWSAMAGAACAALVVALRRPEAGRDGVRRVTVRGPLSYAGPGSLGGTDSAMGRR
ncbi:MAG: hypothetical protein LT070_12285 [Solirubrobacteraceae bacterium]|nr:hypothetical protein [Solirubrobacteraceae bacterium]